MVVRLSALFTCALFAISPVRVYVRLSSMKFLTREQSDLVFGCFEGPAVVPFPAAHWLIVGRTTSTLPLVMFDFSSVSRGYIVILQNPRASQLMSPSSNCNESSPNSGSPG